MFSSQGRRVVTGIIPARVKSHRLFLALFRGVNSNGGLTTVWENAVGSVPHFSEVGNKPEQLLHLDRNSVILLT